jgi:DNA repair protein RecO (recombination protein O)
MRVFETEAIVLTTRDHGESDRLVAFHTADCGRLKGIAKGARRSKKRFVNTFEPGSLVQLECREKNSFFWIEACKLVDPYLPMRTDIEKWAYAALFSEIILEMVPEGESQPDIFQLHKETLGRLEKGKDPLNIVLLALLRFQLLMGYMPSLDGCVVCGRILKTATRWYWQASRGRLLCPDHFPRDENYTSLDLGTLALINYSRKIPLDNIWRLQMRQEIKMPLFRGLLDWVRCHTGREIRSLKVLQQILPPSAGGTRFFATYAKCNKELSHRDVLINPDGMN